MTAKRKKSAFDPTIEKSEALRLLGLLGKHRSPRESLLKEIDEEMAVARDLLEPAAVWITKEAGLAGSARFSTVAPLALAVCTIGKGLEERVGKLLDSGRTARAMILDAIGSAAVESVADLSNGRICAEAIEAGHSPGARRSPGYDRWPVSEQRLIFDLLEPDDLGVALNKACMMVPRKSISFAVPLEGGSAGGRAASRCSRCGLKSCPYRIAS